MKKLSVVIPCYNEEENILPMAEAVENEFSEFLPAYDYEIIFIDNCSADHTRDRIRLAIAKNPRVKAIFNAKNFGQFNSPYYGLLQAKGDAAILMAADFQEPVSLIRSFVAEWEKGYKIVAGIKNKSKENPILYAFRSLYYKIIKKCSDVEQIEHFTGFGLYDQSFLRVLRTLDDPTPFLRGIVAECGFATKKVTYTQEKRRAGKTSNNWYRLYDAAMLSFTSYTKVGLRIATFLGFAGSVVSFLIAVLFFIKKLVNWYGFSAGMAPVIILISLLGSLILLFIGLIGEYILAINQRLMHRPLVVEEERVGDWTDKNEDTTV